VRHGAALALLLVLGGGCGPAAKPAPEPSPSAVSLSPEPEPSSSCLTPWPGEDGGWVKIEASKLEATRDLIRAAQVAVGDTCGINYVETAARIASLLSDEGACAGVMGEDGGEVFIRAETGEQAGLYEQWHPAFSATGCLATGPQKGLWARR